MKGGYMKEYCIYCIWNGGQPFILDTFKSLETAKFRLYDMISLEEERNRPYFVDNDFFDNKYNYVVRSKYFCIKERKVTEWEKYSEEETKIENKNKIFYINNYKKVIDK